MRKILLIGAGGGVGSVLGKRLMPVLHDCGFTLADINPEHIPSELTGANTVRKRVDLFNAGGLKALIQDHDVVLHCAGPFIRTMAPVAEACAARGKYYLDLTDDVEALEKVLALHETAQKTGARMLVGAGVSPGFTNIFAADLMARFHSVDTLDVAWLSGDEGGVALGEAVLEHVLHIAGGKGARWRNGRLEQFNSYTIPSSFPMGGGLGKSTLFEVAHPEPLMLSRTFPGVPLIRCFGGINPPAIGSVVRGVARAVHQSSITREEAILFLQAASSGRLDAVRAWPHALRGITDGLANRMISAADVLTFAAYLLGRHQVFAGGVLCRATGNIDGVKRTLILRSRSSGPGTFIDSMPNATGTCAAAFTLNLLEAGLVEPGVHFPEELNPHDVYRAIETLGFNIKEMIDDVFEVNV